MTQVNGKRDYKHAYKLQKASETLEKPRIKSSVRRHAVLMTRKALIVQAKTLTTSNHYALEASQPPAIHACVVRAPTRATTENKSLEKQWKS